MNDQLARGASRVAAGFFALVILATPALPAFAQSVLGPAVNKPGPALAAFEKAYADVNDYTLTDTVTERTNDGGKRQDRVYEYKYLKPHEALANIVSGAGAGGGAAWRGGDKVKGHLGGLLAGIKLIIPVDDGRATSMRGNTIDQGTFTYALAALLSTPGTLSEAPGPASASEPTTIVTLDMTKPNPHGETKVVAYLSDSTHLPVKREVFAGSTLVIEEQYTNVKTNVGLKLADIDL